MFAIVLFITQFSIIVLFGGLQYHQRMLGLGAQTVRPLQEMGTATHYWITPPVISQSKNTMIMVDRRAVARPSARPPWEHTGSLGSGPCGRSAGIDTADSPPRLDRSRHLPDGILEPGCNTDAQTIAPRWDSIVAVWILCSLSCLPASPALGRDYGDSHQSPSNGFGDCPQ
jgi:hypothetical protein